MQKKVKKVIAGDKGLHTTILGICEAMTAALISTMIIPSQPSHDDPCHPLWQKLQRYRNSSDDDRQFFEHIDAIARQPIGSPRRKRAIEQLYLFIRNLPYNSDKRFKKGKFENPIRDEYENILESVMAIAITEMWSEFNPTGASFTGCFINWIKRKLRLDYLILDFFKDIKNEIPDEVKNTDCEEPINFADLNQQIESDQAKFKKQQARVLDAFAEDVERSPFWETNYLMNDPRCTYRMLANRLLFGTDRIQTIVDELQFEYQAFYAQLQRDFYPAVLLRRLENNLFAPSVITSIRETIASNPQFDRPVYNKMPEISPKFMAECLLPIFRPQPMTFTNMVEMLRGNRPKTYRDLNEEVLAKIWRNKCYPKIGKEMAKLLHYSKGSDI